ncbi:MAG: ornithine carbamoyltransferase [Candidatus Aminicenantes bacterium]|nr:ornithine carbamoyltransferase [Candidatus Aminicenantes bacterium]
MGGKKDFLSIKQLSFDEFHQLLGMTAEVKKEPERFLQSLQGKALGLFFEKPSTRTRLSFEVGIYQLGGVGLYFSPQQLQIGRGETIADTARVLSRYLDALMARVFSHQTLEELAQHGTIPVINGLSDRFHPCQGMADYFTIQEELGRLRGVKVCYIGDGNNVCHSLLLGAAKAGVDLRVVSPKECAPDPQVVNSALEDSSVSGAKITVTDRIEEGVKGAEVVYTDVWVSMGEEKERASKLNLLQPYQVNEKLMALAEPGAIFMHCLPAHREEEVTSEVIDSEQSVVWNQAENRLHFQKALLIYLLKS